jgi:DNA-binding PadR family transcriptional regulator
MSKIAAMVRIRDATDNSGGAKFPTYMMPNMRSWEREGLVELHRMTGDLVVARITDKGRALAKKSMDGVQ